MVLYTIFIYLLILLWSVKRFSTYFNPVTLVALGFLLPTLSLFICEKLDLLRGRDLSLVDTSCIYNLIGYFSFLFPWMKYRDIDMYKSKQQISFNVFFMSCKILIMIISICLIMAFISLGGVPFLRMLNGNLDVEEYNALLSRLPMGLMSIIGALSTVLYLQFATFIMHFSTEKEHKLFIATLLFMCVLTSMWQGKRQGLLLFIFIVIVFMFQRARFRFNFKTVRKIIIIVGIFFMFGGIFTHISSIRNNTDESNQFELLEYAMFAPMNWAYMTDLFSPYGTVYFPSILLCEIIPRRLGGSLGDFRDNLFEPTSPSGYFSYWYADYGILGVVMGGLLLGYISKFFYLRRNRSEYYMYIYILILWCCVTVVIYSHLLTITLYTKLIFLNIYFSLLYRYERKYNQILK